MMSKPRGNDNDNDYNNNKNPVITSTSKIHDDQNVIFFVPVAVSVEAADNGGTHRTGVC
jgi:hypothetical protein